MSEVCAYVPFWSQSDAMNWDSNYVLMRRLLPHLARLLPDWVWIIFWPDPDKGNDENGWRWYDDGLFDDPRFVKFHWPYDTSANTGTRSFDPMRFAQLEKTYSPTIFLVHQSENAMDFYRGYTGSYNKQAIPSLVVQHNYVIHKSLPYPFESLLARLWGQIGSSIAADRVLFNSHHTEQMARESFGNFLNDATLEKIFAKSSTILYGYCEDTTLDMPIAPMPPRPTFIYNHRFELYKQPRVTAAVLDVLKQRGHRFDTWVTQTVGQKANIFRVDRVVGHPDFCQYIKNIAIPAINTTNSKHETFGMSVLDSIALGHIIVAPNSVTFPELLPKGYPFLFKSTKDQTAMLEHILSTWPAEWEKWHAVLRQHARQHFHISSLAERYAQVLLDESTKWRVVQPQEQTIENWQRVIATLRPGWYAASRLFPSVRAAMGLAQQAMPNRRAVRELCMYGATVGARNGELYIYWPGLQSVQPA